VIDDRVVDHYLSKLIGEPGVYLLEQPTGAGKSTLASVLAMKLWHFGRINSFIFVRTHALIEEYIDRIRNLSASYEFRDILATPVFGKGNGFNCPEYRATVANDPLSIYIKEYNKGRKLSEIIEKFIEEGLCPYFSLKYVAKNSPIVVATYNHLTDGSLFTAVSPLRYVIFIDEAHNMLDFLIDSRIRVINIRSLHILQTKFEKVGWEEERRADVLQGLIHLPSSQLPV